MLVNAEKQPLNQVKTTTELKASRIPVWDFITPNN